jgi:hypothetical protein
VQLRATVIGVGVGFGVGVGRSVGVEVGRSVGVGVGRSVGVGVGLGVGFGVGRSVGVGVGPTKVGVGVGRTMMLGVGVKLPKSDGDGEPGSTEKKNGVTVGSGVASGEDVSCTNGGRVGVALASAIRPSVVMGCWGVDR